ncbi:GNAT family N-acetyltransferase [Rhodococcus marinonascens]|uniref:GNAT family N-acetyltransferase n=1 Tax=Rhodococcus marinonascens TaxID=38311 RepID=UPI0009321F41|nr:GNAT family N-acetyltransferase [Rhodococcus marinonascens]
MTAVALKRSWALDLDNKTLYQLLELRVQVFVVEQACPYPELDGRDLLVETRHFWLEQDGRAVCSLRLLEEHETGSTSFRIGRLCTAAPARGQGHATRLLRAALAEVGEAPCRIKAQTYLVDMYAQHGFTPEGEEFVEDGIPHVPMWRGGGAARVAGGGAARVAGELAEPDPSSSGR